MMKTTRAIQFVAAAFVLSLVCISATAQEIKYNFLPGTDFAKYKTYKWVRVPNAQYPNQILDGQIMRAIDAQLALKGLSKTADETADLYVCYQAAVSEEKLWNSYTSDMGGGGWG